MNWLLTFDVLLHCIVFLLPRQCDVILKYSPDEARALIKYGEIPDTTTIHENVEGGEGGDDEDEVAFEFNDGDTSMIDNI